MRPVYNTVPKPCSHSFPANFRLQRVASGATFPPPLMFSSVLHHRAAWKTLGELSAVVLALIGGTYSYPERFYPTWPIHSTNHTSWSKNPKAQIALTPVIQEWLDCWLIQYCPMGSRMPLCILPIWAVPKDCPPGYSLIIDGGPINHLFQPLPVCYVNHRAFALMLQPQTITAAVDLKNAYHLGCLSGCPMGDEEGCDPTTCSGTCDRNLLGFSAFNLFFCFRV